MVQQDSLQEYRKKRDFTRTPEPAGVGRKPGAEPIFVIQKHDASTLHYDFRLEVDGVLKSWAVPKGPSTNPRDKRLAVPTEDHPLEYADFEGVIPKGEYGGGTVLVWDIGTYRNLKTKDGQEVPMAQTVANGHVTVWLEGKKLKGGYSFIRTGKGEEARWLLVKMDDSEADASQDIIKTRPESALSGRVMEEVAQQG
ncbi:MAG: DNA polymerase ligase N-terminal domain-containing protein [Anaerolineae bacterium]